MRFYPQSRTTPTRPELDAADKEYLAQGNPFKADVFVIVLEGGPMVVKDFAPRAWWRRLIGRLEASRECRAYTYLGPMPFIPEFYGSIDCHALAVEKIDGVALALSPDRGANRDDYLAQIRTTFDQFTRLGFLHLDARNNKNLLLRPDGQVMFIDLAGSFWIRPGRFGHRLLRRISALYYEANVIKWETLLHPGGDPRKGMRKPLPYLNGLSDLRTAWKRLRERRQTNGRG